jgi:hypothetical protein
MNSIDSVKVALPLPASANAKTLISTCTSQSGVIKQCPAYSTTTAVQGAVGDMDTAVTALQGTVAKVDQARALLLTLETTRDAQVVTVRLKHDGVETALNTASNGDPDAAQAWVGKTKSRAAPVPVSTSTNPPENPALQNVKSQHGAVKASCTAETGAVCYLFQQGADPAQPGNWPAPTMTSGSTFTLRNQPIGQLVYLRIAVVRRGSVQGQWSPVLQITVR